MIFVEEEHCFPDVEAVWKDMCQMKYLEGVGALIEGLPRLRMDLFWQEQIVTSDLLLRFFDKRVRQLSSFQSTVNRDIDWLKEQALIVFLEACTALRDYDIRLLKPQDKLLKTLLVFFRDYKPVGFTGDDNDDWTKEINSLCCSFCDQIGARLCQEVDYVACGINSSTHNHEQAISFLINDFLTNDGLIYGKEPEGGWKVETYLDFCETRGYNSEKCALLRIWLRNKKARKILGKVLPLGNLPL